jgi:hypothetical protein
MFKKILKTTISGVLGITIISIGYFQTFQQPLLAQSANPPLRVTCAPDKPEVKIKEKVTWTAVVENAGSGVIYRWSGEDLTRKTSRKITSNHLVPGRKTVEVTVRYKGDTATARCSVNVVTELGQNGSGQN